MKVHKVPSDSGKVMFPVPAPKPLNSQMEVCVLWGCVVITKSLDSKKLGLLLALTARLITHCGHLACWLILPIREQWSSQPYCPWIFHIINFYTLS